MSGNFIFDWPDVTEYLLDLDEKWMVREVDICSFRGVSRKNDGLGVKGLKNVKYMVCCWDETFLRINHALL